jgi:hypothetical protein
MHWHVEVKHGKEVSKWGSSGSSKAYLHIRNLQLWREKKKTSRSSLSAYGAIREPYCSWFRHVSVKQSMVSCRNRSSLTPDIEKQQKARQLTVNASMLQFVPQTSTALSPGTSDLASNTHSLCAQPIVKPTWQQIQQPFQQV